MNNIFEIKKPPPLPPDLPGVLRELADDIEKGTVMEFVCAMVRNGQYEFHFPSSLASTLVLATLLQHRSIKRMKD